MELEVAKEKLTNIVKITKDYIVGNTRQKKLDIILDHLIDSIELRGDSVFIKTKKNVAIQNDGHLVQINSGSHVMLSKEIHLNPRIDFKSFDTVQKDLKDARDLEEIEYRKKLKEYQESLEDSGCCKH